MKQKTFAGALVVLVLFPLLISCGKVSNQENKPLTVGMDLSYPPFETIDSSGVPAGISVDMAKALGEYLHRPVEVKNIPFTGLIPSLMTGKIDLIISSMSETTERHKTIEFSDPYVTTIGLCILAGKKSSVTSLKDLDQTGRSIAVRQGTTGQLWAADNIKNAKLVVLDKESSAMMEVVQGKVDGFLYDQLSVWRFHNEYPEETVALLQPVKAEPWAIGLRPNDKALRNQVNLFIINFRKEGGFSRLGDKYLKAEKEAFVRAGVPFSFN